MKMENLEAFYAALGIELNASAYDIHTPLRMWQLPDVPQHLRGLRDKAWRADCAEQFNASRPAGAIYPPENVRALSWAEMAYVRDYRDAQAND